MQWKFQTITSYSQFEKVIVQKSIAELWTIIPNQMINYQLSYAPDDQNSDHKYDIYLHGKPSTRVLMRAANENTKYAKTGRMLFS